MILGLGRYPGEENGYLLQCSCLENSMDRGAWQAVVLGSRKELDMTEWLILSLSFLINIISIYIFLVFIYLAALDLGDGTQNVRSLLWYVDLKLRHVRSSSLFSSVQFSPVTQSCLTLCDPMNCSTPGLPVHHQLPEFTQTHVHRVGDAIQPSHPLSSPSPPAPNLSQHQSLFQ